MLRRFLGWLVGVPVAVVLVVLSVANRHEVTFALDPRGAADAALSYQVPLYLLLFAALLVGLVVGWVVAWAGQSRWRREARRQRRAIAEAPHATRPALTPPTPGAA